MSIYTPDRWIVLEFNSKHGTFRKVFAGWYGGFLGSDSWKLNSGIVQTKEFDNYYEFTGETGSIYRCAKDAHGMSMFMGSVYSNWLKDTKEDPSINIKEIDLEDIMIS